MKTSCPEKELKVIASTDTGGCLNDPKEKDLTAEQIYINKKLSESGIEDEGLDWLEKRNILKTINVSLKTSANEKSQRNKPRLARTVKWVENSFENNNKEDSAKNSDDEKSSKTRRYKPDSEVSGSPTFKTDSSLSSNNINQEIQEKALKINNKREHQNVEINGNSPKSSKKVHYIKIHLEEKEESDLPSEVCTGDQVLAGGKKRASSPEIDIVETPKKIKMEETSNGVTVEESVPLKLELEIERRKRNLPFKMRDINAIVFECEVKNKKWKETFLKYKCPARWGVPIVKNCIEKWDGKRIPSKLLHRYQKYLSLNNMFHPVFFPENLEKIGDLSKSSFEISSQSSVGTNNECKDELENNFKDPQNDSFAEDELNISENNLNASTSDDSGRMVLRNRNAQKLTVIYEDDISSDDSDEWSSKKKPVRKQKINSKSKKQANQNKQLLLKLERCNLNKKTGGEDGQKSENGGENAFGDRLLMGINSSNQSSSQSKPGPDPDTMVCPICSLRFKKQLIESHATECASKTYKD